MSGPVTAAHGMVATSQILATDVGVELLERGGSAVDAAIGANAMLSLCEPFMCGPGGDLFAIVWDPATRKLHGLNASGRSPRAQSLAELKTRLDGDQAIPVNGVHSITVPGAVRGWAALHQRFGRLNLGDIFAPVIEYAAAGVKIGPATAAWWHKSASMAMSAPTRDEFKANLRKTFLLDGRPPNAGDTVRNQDLVLTYTVFALRGFYDFYTGDTAALLVAYLARVDCR
ncbi:MAG: gamma-glutamyltransferase, partial [Proteobacteria bacterium]|nr:gamma-glutamyltransferase [Pseudomonadota bacterium]